MIDVDKFTEYCCGAKDLTMLFLKADVPFWSSSKKMMLAFVDWKGVLHVRYSKSSELL